MGETRHTDERGEWQECPTPDAHEKLREASYFLRRVIENVHHPSEFRYNLSAFLQAARSVDYFLLNHAKNDQQFAGWYEQRRGALRQEHPALARVVAARNLVVHERILNHRSQVSSGIFLERRKKFTIETELPLDIPSEELLENAKRAFLGRLLDEEHVAIGEQIGIERIWVVGELDLAEDVTILAYRALIDLHVVMGHVHAFYGASFEPIDNNSLEDPSDEDLAAVRVLLETDLDPSLPERWNW